MNQQFTQLLTKRRFLPLFITQFLGAFNDNIFRNAMLILIAFGMSTKLSVPTSTMTALCAVVFTLPFFILSALAGQLADKYEKSLLIRFVKVIEIAAMLLGAVGFYYQSLSILMFTLFLLGTHSTFFGPIKYSILPDHLPQKELVAANALIESATFIAILFGTIIGTKYLHFPHKEAIVAALMLGTAVTGLACSFFIPKAHVDQPDLKISGHLFRETINIMRYAKSHSIVFTCILGLSWFWMIGLTFLTELPDFVKNYLHSGDDGTNIVTLLLCVFTIGIAIGSFAIERLQKGRINATYAPISVLGISVFMIDLYFASHGKLGNYHSVESFILTFSNWRLMFDLFMISFCGGMFCVPLYAMMQHYAPESHRSRVIAANNIINALFMTAGGAITALVLFLHVTIPMIFLSIGILNLAIAIYTIQLLPDAIAKSILRWILTLLFRVEVKGMENYERAGNRTVIIANHSSFLDAILLSAFLPDKLIFAINTYIARSWLIRPVLKLVDAYPLDPMRPMSTKGLIKKIKENKRCMIFPEGRITVTGALMKIYEGPGMIADKADAKLLPIRIEGAQYSLFTRLKGKIKTEWFPKITMTILPEHILVLPDNVKGRARRRIVSAKLYDLMTELMFDSSNYNKTLFQGLVDASKVAESGHKVIEDIKREPLSYRQFITKSFALGSYIASHSQRGEYIGLLLPNVTATAVAFFACHAYSRVPAMINYSTGSHNVLNGCHAAQIKQVYTSRQFIETGKFQDMVDRLKEHNIKITYLEDLADRISWRHKLLGFIHGLAPGLAYKQLNPKATAKDPAVVLFTSGSEGTPKGVVLSHRNIQANRFQLAARIDFTPQDMIFNALPVFHSFGLTGGMMLPLLSGLRTFFYPSPLHYRVVPELTYDSNSTILFGTDTFLAGYARMAHPYDFYSLRYVFAGAEKLKDSTREAWINKFGIRIFEGYGATETAPALAINTPMQNKPGSVGRLLPKIIAKLEDVPGIDDGGRLVVAGPNIMMGYLKTDRPGVIQAPKDDWYDTGDIVNIDEAGYVHILGRAKRFAKVAGEMVSLTAVETYINQLWPGHLHAIVSIPDYRKGEQLVLVTNYEEADRSDLRAHFKNLGVSEIQLPKHIMHVKDMKLLGSGKFDYPSIQKDVEAAFATP